MNDEDRRLLRECLEVTQSGNVFALDLVEDRLTPDEQRAFAMQLLVLAEHIRWRVNAAPAITAGSTETFKSLAGSTPPLRDEGHDRSRPSATH
jgi:hypothetical protein